jgi:hypothetical protein
MNNGRITKGFQLVISAAILWFMFGLARPGLADLPVVSAELAHGNWIHFYGDRIDNNNLPCMHQWMLNMNVASPDTVTGPRVEFHSDSSFVGFDPYPTLFTPPSTYIWDYPDRSLPTKWGSLDLHPVDGGIIARPGFTALRSVDYPLLLNDVTTQITDFTLKFDEPLPADINNVNVHLGAFTTEQDVVEESILWQNNVPGWSNNGDGWWSINPNDIVVGTNYNFQVQTRCTKKPQYSGIAIYYKPQAFVITAEWNDLPDVNGPNTVIIHPEGETAYYQLNEPVEWHRSTSLNRQDAFLNTVSVPIDDSDPEVNDIELDYGKQYNAAGTYIGHSFEIDVEGKNVVAAEVTTPTGRTWPLEVDEDWIGYDHFELLTTADLTALGIVEGTYNFAFYGLLGKTITTSVNMTFDTPTQAPHITYPSHWSKDVELPLTIEWEPAQDINISTIAVMLENEDQQWEEEWDFDTELPPDQNSCLVSDIPPYDRIDCEVAFGNMQTGQTPEGIKWSTCGYTLQSIYFACSTFRGDFDGDGDVDSYDFATIAEAWLSEPNKPNWNPACDISEPKNNIIDWRDFAVFAQDWLAGVE